MGSDELAGTLSRGTWERVARLRRKRGYRNAATLGLVLLGPVLAALTFIVMGPLADAGAGGAMLRLVVLVDLLYLIVLTGLVAARVVRIVAARRKSAVGSRLHLRLVGVFATIALVPTVLVALFAGLTLSIGLEGWFSNRVQQVVSSSLSAAEAYQDEHRRDLTNDAKLLAGALTQAARRNPMLDDGVLRQLLEQGQGLIQRGLREAYVIDGRGTLRARGERSYQFWYEQPSPAQFDQASATGLVLIEDWQNNEFRALVRLPPLADRYL